MKNKEIAALLMENPEMTCMFSYDYGDHVHTQVATEVTSADILLVKPNGYVRSHALCLDQNNEPCSREEWEEDDGEITDCMEDVMVLR